MLLNYLNRNIALHSCFVEFHLEIIQSIKQLECVSGLSRSPSSSMFRRTLALKGGLHLRHEH